MGDTIAEQAGIEEGPELGKLRDLIGEKTDWLTLRIPQEPTNILLTNGRYELRVKSPDDTDIFGTVYPLSKGGTISHLPREIIDITYDNRFEALANLDYYSKVIPATIYSFKHFSPDIAKVALEKWSEQWSYLIHSSTLGDMIRMYEENTKREPNTIQTIYDMCPEAPNYLEYATSADMDNFIDPTPVRRYDIEMRHYELFLNAYHSLLSIYPAGIQMAVEKQVGK